MMKDMILHTRNEESVRLGRTRVRLKAYCSAPWGVLRTMLMLLMMTVGVNGAWGQTADYSGTYFIGSRGYIPANTTTNFYLCPTEGWAFYVATDNVQGGDNGQPFLTTYQCRDGSYDAQKAIWNIEKDQSSDCYYIKQVSTGRYIVSNGVLPGAVNTRARVHLETVSNADALAALGDLALFEIIYDNDHYDILPHSVEGRDGDNKYLVVNTNNYNQLDGNNIKTNGPTGFQKCGGIIGLYTHPDGGNAYFYLEDAHCATPTISLDGTTGQVTIETTTTGATIYYTTNGSTPDPGQIGGDNPTKLYDTSNKPIISTETTIKAIAVEENHVNSLVASLSVSQVATPTIEDNGENGIIITCETEGATIFYTLDPSEDPATPYTSGTILREGFSNKTIRVIAIKSGYLNSAIGSGSVKLKCDPPIISQDEGKKFTLSATFPIAATPKYSINDENGTYYDYDGTPVPFSEYGDVIYAKATHADYYDSDVTSLEMVKDLEGEGTAGSPYLITSQPEFALFVSWINNKAEKRSLHYKLQADINGGAVITQAFTGILEGGVKDDGSFYKISNLHHALFNTVNGGTVKNVILDNVSISGGTNVGAICNEATGASRIYNCGILATNSTIEKDKDGYDHISSSSSTISGSGYVGGIVGLLDGTSRVINCFSYANVSGGSHVGGIVGYNNVATTSAANNLKTMVMNCMFYGEVSGTSIAPIYNGEIITNDGDADGVNNFNYFRLESSYIKNTDIPKVYNCALGAETRFLQRFEFFRHLLNSNRELAAWWASTSTTTVTKDDMMKWVMEPTQIGTTAPYPILKTPDKYASVVNYTPSETAYDEANRNKGRKLTNEGDGGVLHVTIQMGSGGAVYSAPSGASLKSGETGSIDLTITDKDYEHYNFNYAKVQLPYYNDYCDGNYTENRVVTGWKIVEITGGTAGNYTTGDDVTYNTNGELTATPYNFADRKCTNKDLYGTDGSNRVFNQGAYWDVPEGVTAITIEPYWGKAVYLADAYWDVVYKNGTGGSGTGAGKNYDAMTTATNVPNVGGGVRYNNSSTFDGQVVFTSIGDAISSSNNNGLFKGVTGTPKNQTVYDYAVVLVGNYHRNYLGTNNDNPDANESKPYTVTSVDKDGDNEPDYSFMMRFNGRTAFHPVRYDFLNLIGLGMAQKTTGGIGSYNLGILQPKYWFEVTNTALFRVTQFEYSPNSRAKKPIILQGGVIEQWVTQQDNAGDRVEYFHVGGNVWFKEFHRGSHQDNAGKSTPHPPLSVTGGDFSKFYLTGLYQSNAAIYDDNAECYINGGRFGEMAGAGMEGIGTSDGKGNITWIIDNADIKEFYGGGINFAKPVHGNIHTIISNSHVDVFCGGPKFGDMEDERTVTTTATNCTFGTYFGAGYGGNSYNRQAPRNHNNIVNFPHKDTQGAGTHASWNAWLGEYYKQDYNYGGVSTQFDYQFLPMSSNTENVARIFVEYVGFSLATTHNVTSSLTGCTITGNFYGGGSLGKVDGDVTSTLTNCTVNGSAFGAGFSGNLPTVEVDDPAGFATEPYYYEALGTYRTGVKGATTTYTWKEKKSGDPWVENTKHILYTTENLNDLGTVSGNVTLNILGDQTHITGDVYGGAAEAKSNTDYYKDTNPDPNTATTVNLLGGTIDGSAYGGGLGNLGKLNSSDPTKYDVEPVAADVGNTTLNLNGMAVTDYKTEYGTWGESFFDHAVESDPYTIPDASKGCIVKGNIFGCNNLNGTPKGHAKVHIYKTQNAASSKIIEKIGIDAMSEAVETGSARDKLNYWIAQAKKNGVDEEVVNAAQNVYNQGDEATDEIIIAQIESLTTITESSAAKNQYDVKAVYGGGNLAPYIPTNSELPYTTANENTLNKVFAEVIIDGCDRTSIGQVYGGGNAASSPATKVDVNGTYEIGELFGGGNGKDDISKDGGVTRLKNPGANVGYKEYADNATNAQTPSDRQTNYGYGSGKAEVNIYGGRIHSIYGGSNTKGNVRRIAVAMLEELQGSDNKPKCAFNVDEAYGGGKSATMDGEAHLEMKCIPGLKAAYGGAENADIQNNVTINITNGKFSQVFGGNNMGGRIMGGITVNVEETGCRPVIIGELYGGGNRASYSVYGYKPETDEDGIVYDEFGKIRWLPLVENETATAASETYTALTGTNKYPYPQVNVKSFTSIGEVYGGGYGTTATMVGDPHVNINVVMGDKTNHNEAKIETEGTLEIVDETEDHVETTREVKYPTHTQGKIGAIRNVFGGGNAARVVGDTYVNIGTDETVDYVTTASGEDDPRTGISVVGADIRGNVYGGGNKAEVTGSTNVNIGKQPTTP